MKNNSEPPYGGFHFNAGAGIMNKFLENYKLRFFLLMALFGCMGPIVRAINLPTMIIACLRAWISALFLIIFMLLFRRSMLNSENKKVILPMIICGIFMAGDWIGLFQAYKYTTIATATVCYYTSPIIIFIASPVLFKEKFSSRHIICAITALLGMFLVSGMVENGIPTIAEIKGVLFALLGAVCYAGVTLMNKKLPNGDTLFRTAVQLAATAVLLTPYMISNTASQSIDISAKTAVLLLILGIIFTALPYIRYMDFIQRIPARTISFFSYADPVVAVLISVLILKEPLSITGLIGSVLILISAAVSEI